MATSRAEHDRSSLQPRLEVLKLPVVPLTRNAGLDQHQVRRWISWQRWTVLAMLAYAFLATLTATEHTDHPTPDGLIALTCNEIHHLFNACQRGMRGGVRLRAVLVADVLVASSPRTH